MCSLHGSLVRSTSVTHCQPKACETKALPQTPALCSRQPLGVSASPRHQLWSLKGLEWWGVNPGELEVPRSWGERSPWLLGPTLSLPLPSVYRMVAAQRRAPLSESPLWKKKLLFNLPKCLTHSSQIHKPTALSRPNSGGSEKPLETSVS